MNVSAVYCEDLRPRGGVLGQRVAQASEGTANHYTLTIHLLESALTVNSIIINLVPLHKSENAPICQVAIRKPILITEFVCCRRRPLCVAALVHKPPTPSPRVGGHGRRLVPVILQGLQTAVYSTLRLYVSDTPWPIYPEDSKLRIGLFWGILVTSSK